MPRRIARLAAEVQALHLQAHPDIFKAAGPDTFPAETIRARMAMHGHRFWVAIEDGTAIGYAYAIERRDPETPWQYAAIRVTLDQMAVTASGQRRGAGRGLVETVRRAARDAGATEVRLSVWAFNTGARAFYARCGFSTFQERLHLPT